jgi:hypothetical protein
LAFVLGNYYDGAISLGYGNQYILPPPGELGDLNTIYGLSIIEHEINEVLGIGDSSFQNSSVVRGFLGPMNLFSYEDSNGRFYFSIDGGHTLLAPFIAATGGDPGDWLSCNQAPNNVQGGNCFGQVNQLDASSPEVVALSVIGYDSTAVPEPSTWLLLGSGLIGLVLWRRRQGIVHVQ